MTSLLFSEKVFLKAASSEEDFTNLGSDGFERGAENFLKSFYADALENEFLDYSLDDLILLARDFWMIGNRRRPSEFVISVKSSPTPSGASKTDTAIQIVCDDMSFLVDSLVAAISSFGVNVSGLFHPIVEGWRDEEGKWSASGDEVMESMILLMIPPQSRRSQKRLEEEIRKTLEEVKLINADFLPLVQNVRMRAEELKHAHGKTPKDDVDEGVAFLEWLADGNFVLFGARRYDYTQSSKLATGDLDYVNPTIVEGDSLGLLRDASVTILRQSSEPSSISTNVERFVLEAPTVTVAKSNMFTRVHRRVRMDYISVKHFSKTGKVTGETRYVGLFTAEAYNRSPQYVPLIRQKVARVKARSGWTEGSHNAKRLEYVLASYPRDELFQIDNDELLRIATGIAQAFDRPRTRVFVRRDRFERFVSVLVYIQQEHYNTRVRQRIGERLKEAFGGRVSAFYPQYSDAPMARVHFIIGMDPDEGLHPDLDVLEAQVASIAQPWFEGVRLLSEDYDDDNVFKAMHKYKGSFSVAYQDEYSSLEALSDIVVCETMSSQNPIAVRVFDTAQIEQSLFKVKIYQLGERLEPSRIMPVFSNFNCHIVEEMGHEITRSDGTVIWVHDYEIRLAFKPDDVEKLTETFESAFLATWNGFNEDDAFNRLILPQNAAWRDIAFLRLVAGYRRQSGLDPSESTQIEALEFYPSLTRLLLELKTVKFDPSAFADLGARQDAVKRLEKSITAELTAVSSLEHDRVVRRIADVILAGLRTNFYQPDDGQVKPYISLKVKSDTLDNLPEPRPYREVYVSSPRVEGVHLRFGPVARGGLRWSDRRDDFRTEVLGLVKAQQVKNAVIVPVGSKGGFFAKQLPKTGTRDDVQAEAIEAYKTFISGILDLTDNYVGEGTVPPANVVCWDDPDPYLVVAADKGTATFSDIANGISQSYGYWLDDAFASGGSVGYDHKVMGITARGGWEAVKRHFREDGKDIQTEVFTVVGVGDMSGDVFGNGMLLSKHIKLVAAFNHLDIFIDPDPDPSVSFKERKRMFELPRSTWQDYDKSLISKGGGVFSRQEKAITLTPEIMAITGLTAPSVTPNQLLKALLSAPAELLWFGGIGTYIKSENESHADVGDKANDAIRINGSEVKAKVVGEGANLGVTQAGRIEFARSGGRINTDAIDNSAGVDSSDNEVNIKILLGSAIDHGELKREERDALLASMTDEVADLVLAHNYDQTGALSLAQMRAIHDHDAYERLMSSLVSRGVLNRTVQGLPGTEAMQALAANSQGLTRPELSVLLAYAKITLFDDVIDTDVADDPFMADTLEAYFPKALHGFDKALANHRLRREIIISRLINLMIDVCGPVFTLRLQEQTQGTLVNIAKAFIVAYETLNVAELRDNIAALDNKVDAKAQLRLHNEIANVLQRVVAWLVRHNETGSIAERVEKRGQLSGLVDSAWLELLSPYDQKRADKRIKSYTKLGISEDLATDVALLKSRASGFDVIGLAEATGWPAQRAAELFYDIGGRFKIDRIRSALLNTKSSSHWERLAMRHLQEDFFKAQARFAQSVAIYAADKGSAHDAPVSSIIADWVRDKIPQIKTYEESVTAMSRSGGWTVPKFAIVNAQLSDLMAGL
ncbi:MAG: NAD-glutamate dehydrogenase [Alphaproteobacteria bacterium]